MLLSRWRTAQLLALLHSDAALCSRHSPSQVPSESQTVAHRDALHAGKHNVISRLHCHRVALRERDYLTVTPRRADRFAELIFSVALSDCCSVASQPPLGQDTAM